MAVTGSRTGRPPPGHRADGYPVTLGECTGGRARREKHGTLDAVGRPLSVEAPFWDERYAYDAAGRVVLRRRTRLSRTPDVWRYAYDAEDRLVSCTTPDGTVWTYGYDPLGRRSAKHKTAPDGTTAVETIRFTWDGPLLVEQYDETPGTILTWEYGGHRPLLQYERRRPGDDDTDARFFAIVTDLADTPTELGPADGETAWRARSTTWGTATRRAALK
ncbi:hypothetical protein [Streptomyces sp. NPDC088557]|uniref:hypothetical protein n=1 Tax=Streptomyces sp. NPDC088557 TaxID=3365867 RepID=UPI00381B1321